MIEIEIDGKKLEAEPNAMVIQVADKAGIYIPRFCYHKHLSVAANCRMCLVEVEKAPKPLPACATPVAPGLKVFTRSPKAIAAQKAVMEFLLINHPLDCPICDQGGECELQDLSMGFGSAESNYCEGKRSVMDENLGPLIATEMTRCIQCTRCVRFGEEVAGFRELGAVGRGEDMEISTYVTHAMQSEVSGNIIDLCPVGALTSKPYRFTSRPWELTQHNSIAAHDCVGSNIHVHTRNGRVMRVVPRENNNINQTWISDRDRFGYEALYHHDRLARPMIRKNDILQETDWQTALEFAATELLRVIANSSADYIGALASPNSTLEEFYLLQKLMRSLGSSNVDHRLRQTDFSDQDAMPLFPALNATLTDLENADTILLIGSNIQKEQPLAALRVRKASRKGAKIFAVNMLDINFHFALTEKIIAAPQNFVSHLENNSASLIEKLRAGKNTFILLGAMAFNHPEAALTRGAADRIAKESGAKLAYLTEGANAAGAWMSGFIPHRGARGARLPKQGMNAQTMLRDPRQAYILLNAEPDYDFANSKIAQNAFEQAECVISLSMFRNPALEQFATVIFPVAPFTETSGTFINLLGEWQTFRGTTLPFGESRPAWKVLRVLGNLCQCEHFDYSSSDKILEEIKHLSDAGFASSTRKNETKSTMQPGLRRIGDIPIYSGDSIVRRAKSLQATQPIVEKNVNAARIHANTARSLDLKDGDMVVIKQNENRAQMQLVLDDKIPEQAVYVAGALTLTRELGDLFGEVEIQKIN